MSSILALETSGSLCSVCVDVDGTYFENTEHVERRHNELLLPMVEATLSAAGLARANVSAIAFGCGPGSFTGVRIAAAASQALALALEVPAVPVSSSLMLANAARRSAATSCPILTSVRSRGDLHYVAAFQGAAGELTRVVDDTLCCGLSELPFAQALLEGDHVAIGAKPDWWSVPVGFAPPILATARDVAVLGRRALDRGEGVDAALALPRYVAGDSPWRPAAAH